MLVPLQFLGHSLLGNSAPRSQGGVENKLASSTCGSELDYVASHLLDTSS